MAIILYNKNFIKEYNLSKIKNNNFEKKKEKFDESLFLSFHLYILLIICL